MTPTPDNLSVIAGIIISLALKGLKHIWPGFNDTPALVKQLTAALLVVLTVGFACSWHFTSKEAIEVFWGIVSALGTHALLLGATDPPKKTEANGG